jgi:hypothetical protein
VSVELYGVGVPLREALGSLLNARSSQLTAPPWQTLRITETLALSCPAFATLEPANFDWFPPPANSTNPEQ